MRGVVYMIIASAASFAVLFYGTLALVALHFVGWL